MYPQTTNVMRVVKLVTSRLYSVSKQEIIILKFFRGSIVHRTIDTDSVQAVHDCV